ncbi:MarR family transcriptional regulator [Labedella populi]|uniref:MarR family transcriptional regulator n=1 Tax=Labedella populi TaxID=2498850 RepID=A0A3S3ZNN3_9MICO|nr:MarR family winged helix-turn-helix transcriptional regulator [Labedella populi]RWZ59348.1 MarR family transcriptional regulator [Labedella populi]
MTPNERGRILRTEDRLWSGILRAAAAVPRRLERELAATSGVTLVEFDVLLGLGDDAPASVRIGEIAARGGLSFSRASRAVTALERRELVEREECVVDGRGNQVRITPAGQALLDESSRAHELRAMILKPPVDPAVAGEIARYLDAVAERADSEDGLESRSESPPDSGITRGRHDSAQLFDDLVRSQIVLWNSVESRTRAEAGVPASWYESLRVVAARGRSRGADVARDLSITEGGASKLLSRLEAAGLLERSSDPGDARASLLSVTAAGEAVLRGASAAVRDEVDQFASDRLTSAEVAQLGVLLRKLRGGSPSPRAPGSETFHG